MRTILISLTVFILVASPAFGAETSYQLLAPIPLGSDLTSATPPTTTTVTDYISNAFTLAIALAGLFAVVRIVWAGIKIMSTDSVGNRSEGKEIIRDSIYGFILAIAAYAILYTVDKRLVQFNLTLGGSTAVPTSPSFSSPSFAIKPNPSEVFTQPATNIIPTRPTPTAPGTGLYLGNKVTPNVPPSNPPPPPLRSSFTSGACITPISNETKHYATAAITPVSEKVHHGDRATVIGNNENDTVLGKTLWLQVRFDNFPVDTWIIEKTRSETTGTVTYVTSIACASTPPPPPPPPPSTIAVSARIRVVGCGDTTASIAVRSGGPNGSYITEANPSIEGTVLGGPQLDSLGIEWWEIRFDQKNPGNPAENLIGWSPYQRVVSGPVCFSKI